MLFWQLLHRINLAEKPELIRLTKPGEDVGELLREPPTQLLIRWINHHTRNALGRADVRALVDKRTCLLLVYICAW